MSNNSVGSKGNLKRHSIAAHGSTGPLFGVRTTEEIKDVKGIIHPPAIAISEQTAQKPQIDHEKALLAKRLANMKKRASVNPVLFYGKHSIPSAITTQNQQHSIEIVQEGPAQRRERSLSVNAVNFGRKNQTPASVLSEEDSDGPTVSQPVGSPPLKRNYKTLLGRCYFCGSADHLFEKCGKGEPVECEVCGQLGHSTEFCEEYLSSEEVDDQ